jgi:hypothetical protein
MARPSTFNLETADEICERLAGGESLLSICKDDGLPPQSVVFQWLSKNAEFAENYARARQFWAHSEFERMMQIADTPQSGVITTVKDGKEEVKTLDMTDHRRLQVDTRKWALARMFPKVYGDRINQAISGADGETLKIEVTGIRPTKENT